MRKLGFDNDKYLRMQSEHIKERISKFGGKLYLEFGGKIFDDYHAARVLPGFKPDSKMKMLLQLKDDAEIIIAICAKDIEKNKIRSDLGITYDLDVLRLIDIYHGFGLYVGGVVLTQYSEQPSVTAFEQKLQNLGINVYRHYPIENYPLDVELIVSEEGYGKNDYIESDHSLIVITAPGPGSGKMAVCLSQLYHENKRGIKAGYAKFETFPIWNLPLKHPVNLAYEAATADLNDVNMIDPFHLEAYGETTVNYNRDVENFPVLNKICEEIYGVSPYKSPTDMGVNMAGNCIIDDDVVLTASKKEILRRHCNYLVQQKNNKKKSNELYKIELIMKQLGITSDDRPVVSAALNLSETTDAPVTAIELHDGRIITGKASELLSSASAMLLNALKALSDIGDEILLISPTVFEPIKELKIKMHERDTSLHPDEILIALSICATMNPLAKQALDAIKGLKGCDVHATVVLSDTDKETLRKLGTNATYEPYKKNDNLYYN